MLFLFLSISYGDQIWLKKQDLENFDNYNVNSGRQQKLKFSLT